MHLRLAALALCLFASNQIAAATIAACVDSEKRMAFGPEASAGPAPDGIGPASRRS